MDEPGFSTKAASLYVTTAAFINGVRVPGTEAIAGGYVNANEVVVQHTIGLTFVRTFAAGDVVTLHGYRIGKDGTVGIISNGDGRTRISAHWVNPGF
ncbi:hypothetical protein ABZ816_37100 [Actinosynnema sp. NPDC047251]|uniref:Uncharacterized protein n=1 Tax=Saccharothrix espanaensis (strain ATCC 51144 / DSM 44229 / JCM 9112 / NBRC 15066 / NRRL 15764) TaxID=1179773 RepID=K0JXN1_SACES|nr:hypothetical protein [Saccharothrix espanaensis]CCH32645.1 hypothetical protein BN6_53860 [Saccharothrix espanaensis DSM 44229]